MIQLLLEAGADPNDSREGQGTVLQVASYWGNESTVKCLLEANADVNLQCEGDLDGVSHPQNWIQYKQSAKMLCYIDKIQYSPASGSFEIRREGRAGRKQKSDSAFAGGGCRSQ